MKGNRIGGEEIALDTLWNNFRNNIVDKFTNHTAVSVIDTVLIAVLLYVLFAFLKKNNAGRLIKYIIGFMVVATVLSASALNFTLAGKLTVYAVVIVTLAVVLMFPQELKRNLWRLSSPKDKDEVYSTQYDCSDEELHQAIDDIVRAVLNMAKKDVGALIVIAPTALPAHIIESGTMLDAKLSCPLIECLFNTKAPLHDGAVFIRGNRIVAAGCFLPLSQNTTVDKELGTRHRAALGVTENYKVLTIIVSEETGVISAATDGELTRYYDAAMLTDMLEQVYGLKATAEGKKKKKSRV